MKVNIGVIKDKKYIKYISFNKAVLWRTKQLSLPLKVIEAIKIREVEELIFIDLGKKQVWIFEVSKVIETMELKQVGQEPQYYFPIDIGKKITKEEYEKR